jgi:nitrogen fixation NifU-like protein
MTDLRDLYQEVILDHSHRPRNSRVLESASHHAEGYNPLCGDRFTIYLMLDDGLVKDVSFQGSGCAISTASASLMTESVKGKRIEEAEAMFQRMHALLTGNGRSEAGAKGGVGDAGLGKLAAFSGVRDYPVRVKCATLPWHTLRAALKKQAEVVSTE